MRRDELLRALAGIVAMGVLTLIVDVLADLIQAGTLAPVRSKLIAGARDAVARRTAAI